MSSLLYHIENGVAFITLNRPKKYNTFNREMALLLQLTLKEAGQDEQVRCIYLTGAGKAFCAGQDLAEVVDPNGPGMAAILSEHYNPIITQIATIPKPVVAAVNGVAAGAGANIALACDVVVAAQSAIFLQAFSRIGLIPDSGGTFNLPRIIGRQKASALMMLGLPVNAPEAERMGMIYTFFEDELFEAEAKKIAFGLATMPTQGLALTKQALWAATNNNLQQQLALEDELQQQAAATHDFKEGVQAFLDKREPVFIGK